MTWLTWRQHRVEFWSALAVLALLVPLIVLTGLDLQDGLETYGPQQLSAMVTGYQLPLIVPVSLLPLLVGMFVGVPLAGRDLEQGSYLLVWTQGITRSRWLRAKVMLAAAACLACFAALALAFWWWNQPVNAALGGWDTFDVNGIMLVPYGLFGLALGIFLGVVFGKTLPAMALSIPLFLGTRAIVIGLRGMYLPPLKVIWNFSGSPPGQMGWQLHANIVHPEGDAATTELIRLCGPFMLNPDGSLNSMYECLQQNGYTQEILYHPLERFWLFQGIESAIFLALAAGLIAAAAVWLSKKYH